MAQLGGVGQYAYLWAVSQDIFSGHDAVRQGVGRQGTAGQGKARQGWAIRLPMSGIIGQFSVNFGQNNKAQ